MKKVLSLLLAFVFVQTQSWAITGGPFDNANNVQNVVGTYSGVLTPQAAPVAGGTSTSLGLFSLSQPATGTATGGIVVFVNGAAFNGTITGLINPSTGVLRAIVDAVSSFVVVIFVPQTTVANGVTTTTQTRQSFPVSATGNIQASVRRQAVGQSFSGTATTPARLTGTASLDISLNVNGNGTPIVTNTAVFTVDGFKQSDTAGGATTFNIGTQQNSNNGNNTGAGTP